MNRAVVLLALLLAFSVFANSGAGGMDSVAGRMVRAEGAVVLTESRQDRCQIATSCSASCFLCAAVLLPETTSLAETSAGGADLHRAPATRPVSERLYRPPKSDGLTLSYCDKQLQNKGTQDA